MPSTTPRLPGRCVKGTSGGMSSLSMQHASLKCWYPGPPRASLSGTWLALEPPSRNQLQMLENRLFFWKSQRSRGQDRGGRFGWSLVKTMSIALAGTLCDPLEQARGSRHMAGPWTRIGENVEVGISSSGEAGRGWVWSRTLTLEGKMSQASISLESQRS